MTSVMLIIHKCSEVRLGCWRFLFATFNISRASEFINKYKICELHPKHVQSINMLRGEKIVNNFIASHYKRLLFIEKTCKTDFFMSIHYTILHMFIFCFAFSWVTTPKFFLHHRKNQNENMLLG